MTSTETPTRTAQQIRRDWLTSLIDGIQPGMDPVIWRAVLDLMISEAPVLALKSNEWWARRIRFLKMARTARELSAKEIVITSLRDMYYANEHNGR